MRAALYVGVGTDDQQIDSQLLELRAYVAARGWTAAEFADHRVCGSKDRRLH
jgi:DNA invertase Pin-like site-specific DNA recombinase